MRPVSVLIVDDSALMRRLFTEMLSDEEGIIVVGTAGDPYEAREKIKQLNPDVLTLDVEMPKMDGIAFLEKIMTLRPMPVIMVSTLTQRGADITLKALELGAFDTLAKPVEQQTPETMAALKAALVEKVRGASTANLKARPKTLPGCKPGGIVSYQPTAGERHLIALGASTGGVETLKDILQKMPANAPPIVITQHMPERFTASFAARLDSLSQMTVTEAAHQQIILPGHAYLAPGGQHLKVGRQGSHWVCLLSNSPPISGHRPSVDVLFHSVAVAVGAHAVGVILTGMGKDGAVGLKAMREQGAYTIGQDQASCIVYGMPQAAMRMGAVQQQLPLAEIPQHMLSVCETKRMRA